MYAGTPVIAVASGGPLETVRDGETGFLCASEVQSFAKAMLKLVQQPALKGSMGQAGHEHVKARFSLQAFAAALDDIAREVARKGAQQQAKGWAWAVLGLGVAGLAVSVVAANRLLQQQAAF